MLAVHRPRAARPFLVAVALLLLVLGSSPPARTDDAVAAGDTVVGELVQAWPEYASPQQASHEGDDAPLSWIDTDDGESIRVDTEDVAHLQAGATVRVTVGDEVDDDVSGAEPAREVLSAQVLEAADVPPTAPASAPYTDEVTVALVLPPGAVPDGTTTDQLVQQVDGPVADFWEGQSNGSIRLHASAAVTGWISASYGCDVSQAPSLWDEVADAVGFTPGRGRHLLLYIPGYPSSLRSCAYGLAEVGSGPTAGGYLYVRGTGTSVIAHELGHNLGLGHSSELQCDRTVETGTCRTWPYHDLYDVMGASWDQLGSLNVVQAARIGLLPADQRQSVTPSTPSTTYTLAPVSGRSGTRALTLTAADGTEYWLEYRPAAGQDSWLGTSANWPRLLPGVLLRRAGTASGDSSLLLDATPSAASAWDGDAAQVLPPGTPVTVGTYTLTVQDTSPTTATVQVSSPITARYAELGGSSGPLGASTTAVVCGLRSGGCYQGFAGGAIYWSPGTGARFVSAALGAAWTAKGAQSGTMGYPVTDPVCGLADSGCFQRFQVGSVYSSAAGGVHVVWGSILQRWARQGWETGPAGYPTGGESCDAGGCRQQFRGAVIRWSPSAGTWITAR